MEFSKRFMKRSELIKMGLPESMLDRAYGDAKQTFAVKMNPTKPNSHIIYDTVGLAKWWERQVALQKAMIGRG